MTIQEIVALVTPYPMTVIFVYLWWDERQARKRSERRHRALLREIAELEPEILTNGEDG